MQHTYREMVKRFSEQGIDYRSLVLDDDSLLLVSAYGGRVYGPFLNEDAPCQMWVPDAFSDPDLFAELIASGAWNVGGERMWIGPEITYIIEDRDDYWGTFVVPPSIDPAPHTFEEGNEPITMRRSGSIRARHTGEGIVDFEATVTVSSIPTPFRYVGDADHELRDLSCGGYAVEIDMVRSSDTDAPMETWDIVQVPSGGAAIIPKTGDVEITDYYEPAGDLIVTTEGAALVQLTGSDKFKVGFKAPYVHGRAAYLQKTGDNDYSLLIRHAPVDPSAPYGEEPDFAPGTMGDPIHIYSDDGPLGGFGEVESRGAPTGFGTGRFRTSDRFSSWWLSGDLEQIDAASQALLGVSVEEALK